MQQDRESLILSKLNFPIILDPLGEPDPTLFLPDEPDRKLNKAEKEWVDTAVAQAKTNPNVIQEAPSAPALRAVQRAMQRYDGPQPVTKEQWQNFVLAKYFEQANDLDPKISKPALDALARTSVVGLHQEVQEININHKTTIELESELLAKISQLTQRKEKVIEGAVIREEE